jgi:Ku70/Ku80 beta-barrel domain
MAPRANWKGYLRLSLVTCPIALYPATSEAEKISFNQINKKTGHRIRYLKVDADTGEEVCQSAFKFDPLSASNFDPFERRVLTVALVSSELAGIAETRRVRVG